MKINVTSNTPSSQAIATYAKKLKNIIDSKMLAGYDKHRGDINGVTKRI